MNLAAEPCKLADGFEFPEGPAFDARGELYLVNLTGGFISRVSLDGRSEIFCRTGGKPNGANFDAEGNLLVAECGLKAIVAVSPEGLLRIVADSCGSEPLRGPNDLVLDIDGGFYFTDPDGSSIENPIGCVYYVSPDRTVRRVAEGLAYPNGLALVEDRSVLIVAETQTRRLYRYERHADGTLGERRIFCELTGGVGPDGMCLDAEGNLYVAHYGAGCVVVIDPAGKQIGQLRAGGQNPTNCCFGPPDGEAARCLFVTETATNAVYRLDIDQPGMRLFHQR